MRAVIQRVKKASVEVDGKEYSAINSGLCCLIGVQEQDGRNDIDYLARKICSMRIFEDDNGLMNLDVQQAGGDILLISQFTLQGDVRKGRRPSFTMAEKPQSAEKLFDELVKMVQEIHSGEVVKGKFQAMMDVKIINHGPVTILLDSRKLF